MKIKLVALSVNNYEQMVRDRGQNQPSLENLLHHEKIRSKETMLHRVGVISSDGKLIGYGHAVSGPWDPTQQSGDFLLEIRVDPMWQKQGIGTVVYNSLLTYAQINGAITLKACVSDSKPEDLAWAQIRGFVKYQHVFASKLDLINFEYSHYSDVLEKVELSGVTLTSLSAYPQNDQFYNKFAEMYYELVLDVPGVEKDNYKPEKLKTMFRRISTWDPEGVTLAVHNGQWVAMTWTTRRPDGNHYNQMTGVCKKYRGQGLGMAIKLKSIEYACNKKAQFLYTHNDSNNKNMLRINQSLGFKPTHGVFWIRQNFERGR